MHDWETNGGQTEVAGTKGFTLTADVPYVLINGVSTSR
jgi:hypothetical protein